MDDTTLDKTPRPILYRMGFVFEDRDLQVLFFAATPFQAVHRDDAVMGATFASAPNRPDPSHDLEIVAMVDFVSRSVAFEDGSIIDATIVFCRAPRAHE